MLKQKEKVKRGFSPIYLAIFSGIILIILIVNGFLEVNRTQKGFYLLLQREAIVLLKHYEKNVVETVAALQSLEGGSAKRQTALPSSGFFLGLEDSIAEYLLETLHRLDQIDGEKPMSPSELQAFVDQYPVTSVEIYDPKGNLLRAWPSQPASFENEPFLRKLIEKRSSVVVDLFGKPLAGRNQQYSIGIWRKVTPGIIALHLHVEQMRYLFRHFAVQNAISDIGLKEDILFAAVQDDRFNILAQTDPAYVQRGEEDPFLKSALQSNHPFSRLSPSQKRGEIFEVVKSFSVQGRPMGLIRIGYSLKEIDPILSQMKKNVLLSILFFLIFGISAITFLWVNQNRHLRRMKDMEDRVQLAERLSSLGHLAAGVAHEIRNPLNAIAMGLQRLKREFQPQDESKKEEYISFSDLILKEIGRMNEIVEQFLTLSRPFTLDLKMSSLRELLQNLITLFQEEACSRGIVLRLETNSELPLIKMDPERLTQALINIMKNGMQSMGQGGTLLIQAKSSKEAVELTISDSGSGISPDQMEKVFNYYYTTKEKGVGLGLPIAHRIIEAHGGDLHIQSQVDVGTKVTLRLPV